MLPEIAGALRSSAPLSLKRISFRAAPSEASANFTQDRQLRAKNFCWWIEQSLARCYSWRRSRVVFSIARGAADPLAGATALLLAVAVLGQGELTLRGSRFALRRRLF